MPDSLGNSTSQRIDEQGRASYQFEGRILARGIRLEADTDYHPQQSDKYIEFINQAGAVVCRLYVIEASQGSGNRFATLRVFNPDAPESAYKQAFLEVTEGPSGASDGTEGSSVRAIANTQVATLIDSNGKSSFLKLASTANRSSGAGVVYLTGNGTAQVSRTFAHGLPFTPLFVLVTSRNAVLSGTCTGRSATELQITGRHLDGVAWTSSQPFDWFAIG